MRWTKNARQAAERLAENMSFKLKKVSKTHVVVVSMAITKKQKLTSSSKKPIAALGYMSYLAIDIYDKDPADVMEAMRFRGNIPAKHGMGPHEESALTQVLATRA